MSCSPAVSFWPPASAAPVPPESRPVVALAGGPGAPYTYVETAELLTAAGAESLGEEAAAAWHEGRFRGPRLRDELLDFGLLVETLETATDWSGLLELHAGVGEALRAALDGYSPVVACHLSHLYPAGASLYFTVVAGRAEDDAVGQWLAAKRAAGDAIASHGGTITHHHAVGTDHAPWMEAEIGALGLEVLRAVKKRLDPAGVLNPGKLGL
jgi:alkyldihydroxyacetonephosphate synthase